MNVDVLSKSEEPAYQEFIEKTNFASIQSSLDWRNLICDLKEDQAYFIIAKQNNEITTALPLYFFKNKLGNVLTSNVWHTISGIISSNKTAEQKQTNKTLLDYAVSLAHQLDCTVLSIGTNPFMNNKECLKEALQPDYVLENFVQHITLSEIFDHNGDFTHPNYIKRTNLSRNLSKIEQTEISISEEQNKENIDQAFILQEKRLNELGGQPFPKKFFNAISKNITQKNRGKFLFAFNKETMIATSLFLSSNSIMDVYMLCMDSNFRNLCPNFALTKHMLQLAQKNRIPTLHWMSSPLKGDGVYKWKEQWGSKESHSWYLTKVIGDISPWKKLPIEELNKVYGFHYLLPLNLLKETGKNTTNKNELTAYMNSYSS